MKKVSGYLTLLKMLLSKISCYIMHFEGQSLMWQGQQQPSKGSHAILRQALLCPEKEKDDIFSLEDRRPVRGGDPLLGASGEQIDVQERRCRKRRLSESSVFDITAGTSQISKFKTAIPAEKLLFESADLMQDDIHPEMEVASQLPADSAEYTCHLLSQLSSSSLLPTMTSSQVSSVLSALEPNTIAQIPSLVVPPSSTNLRTKCTADHTSNRNAEYHVQTDFIKQYSGQNSNLAIVQDIHQRPELDQNSKTKKKITFSLATNAIIRYYTENRIKGYVWYQCSSCPFIAVRRNTIIHHCIDFHDGSAINIKTDATSNLQMFKCLACDNLFSSHHSLKIHYLCDHNSSNKEIEELLKLTIEINKYLKSNSSIHKLNANFARIKPSSTVISEKDIQTPTTTSSSNCNDLTQQIPEETQPIGLLNHQSAAQPLFPVYFTNNDNEQSDNQNQQKNPQSEGHQRLPSQAAPQLNSNRLTTADLHQTITVTTLSPSVITTSSPTTTVLDLPSASESTINVQIQTNKIQHPTGITPKIKDPALKKFRDLKSEKIGGKKCGLGGCALRFGALSNLEYHKKCHHRTKWKCPECHISCTSWNTVSSHLWREHGIDIELYSCDHCNYKTNSLTRLLNLHRRIHSEERPFLCDVCGKGFKTTKQLRNHKSWHKLKEKSKSEIAEKLVTCLTCGRGFTCARLMRLHVQVVHKRLKPYLCYVCGHSAANKSSLRSHQSMHTGLRPYSCNECEYTTRDHNNLRRHKMRHSGIKRYKCPLCSYSSIQASTYKTHILKKHPGQQDGLLYKCQICPFNTVKKENLLTHSARHEGIKTQEGDSVN